MSQDQLLAMGYSVHYPARTSAFLTTPAGATIRLSYNKGVWFLPPPLRAHGMPVHNPFAPLAFPTRSGAPFSVSSPSSPAAPPHASAPQSPLSSPRSGFVTPSSPVSPGSPAHSVGSDDAGDLNEYDDSDALPRGDLSFGSGVPSAHAPAPRNAALVRVPRNVNINTSDASARASANGNNINNDASARALANDDNINININGTAADTQIIAPRAPRIQDATRDDPRILHVQSLHSRLGCCKNDTLSLHIKAMAHSDPDRPSWEAFKRWKQIFQCTQCLEQSKRPPRRAAHPRREHDDSFRPGEFLIADGSGAYKFKTIDGYTQHFVLTDFCSKARFGFPTKSKSAHEFVVLLKQFSADSGVPILKLQGDDDIVGSEEVRRWARESSLPCKFCQAPLTCLSPTAPLNDLSA